MGKIIDKAIRKIVTEEGLSLFCRVTKVLMPNGKYRYPVIYFEETPGLVRQPYSAAVHITEGRLHTHFHVYLTLMVVFISFAGG